MSTINEYKIINANLFNVNATRIWSKGNLTIEKEKFIANKEFVLKEYNLPNIWILPGLIDCHLHICGEPNPIIYSENIKFEPFDQVYQRSKNNAENCIKAGVTTVRDMGFYDARAIKCRERFRSDNIITPRIFSCGNLITGINEHASEFGVETSPEKLLDTVKREELIQIDFVKIINDPVYFSLKYLQNVVLYAQKAGLQVACHAFTKKATEVAVFSNVNSIEHCPGWEGEILEKILLKNIALVPTCISAYDVISNPEEALIDPNEQPIYVYENWWNNLKKYLPEAISKKTKIGIGSDSGFPPTKFGLSVWEEMKILNGLGLDWIDCLKAATDINSTILNQSALGNLNIGSHADFLIFDRDPLPFKSEAVNHIKAVYQGGKCVWGAKIDQLKDN